MRFAAVAVHVPPRGVFSPRLFMQSAIRARVSTPVLWISRMTLMAALANSRFRWMFALTAFFKDESGVGFPNTTPRFLAMARPPLVRSEIS